MRLRAVRCERQPVCAGIQRRRRERAVVAGQPHKGLAPRGHFCVKLHHRVCNRAVFLNHSPWLVSPKSALVQTTWDPGAVTAIQCNGKQPPLEVTHRTPRL